MIAILVGTRPEIIKMAPVLRKLKYKKLPYTFIHSGQHYSSKMDSQIIRDLHLDQPDFNLKVGSGSHAVQTGRIMEAVEEICRKVKPSIMVVHGDTNTTLAGALTAKKMHIPVGHVEAGLRSFDYRMPEEVNRILTDRMSDILFAPTEIAKKNLLNEGISNKTIIVTGNTIVDALLEHQIFTEKSKILNKLNLESESYILVTAHRQENVDDKKRLSKLLKLLEFAGKTLNKKVLLPIHPRTEKQIKLFKLKVPPNILIMKPVGYIEMLFLLKNASFVMTDSGGIQEEAYVLKKPLVTLRDSTERPETLSANFIIDLNTAKLSKAISAYRENNVKWEDGAFGDGNASTRIIDGIQNFLT